MGQTKQPWSPSEGIEGKPVKVPQLRRARLPDAGGAAMRSRQKVDEIMGKIKSAGPAGMLAKRVLPSAAAGAATFGTLHYKLNKRDPKTGKSIAERNLEEALQESNFRAKGPFLPGPKGDKERQLAELTSAMNRKHLAKARKDATTMESGQAWKSVSKAALGGAVLGGTGGHLLGPVGGTIASSAVPAALYRLSSRSGNKTKQANVKTAALSLPGAATGAAVGIGSALLAAHRSLARNPETGLSRNEELVQKARLLNAKKRRELEGKSDDPKAARRLADLDVNKAYMDLSALMERKRADEYQQKGLLSKPVLRTAVLSGIGGGLFGSALGPKGGSTAAALPNVLGYGASRGLDKMLDRQLQKKAGYTPIAEDVEEWFFEKLGAGELPTNTGTPGTGPALADAAAGSANQRAYTVPSLSPAASGGVAAAVTALSRLSKMRRDKNTGRTREQMAATRARKLYEYEQKLREEEGRHPSYLGKIKGEWLKHKEQLSNINAQHPKTSIIAPAVAAGTLTWGVGKLKSAGVNTSQYEVEEHLLDNELMDTLLGDAMIKNAAQEIGALPEDLIQEMIKQASPMEEEQSKVAKIKRAMLLHKKAMGGMVNSGMGTSVTPTTAMPATANQARLGGMGGNLPRRPTAFGTAARGGAMDTTSVGPIPGVDTTGTLTGGM